MFLISVSKACRTISRSVCIRARSSSKDHPCLCNDISFSLECGDRLDHVLVYASVSFVTDINQRTRRAIVSTSPSQFPKSDAYQISPVAVEHRRLECQWPWSTSGFSRLFANICTNRCNGAPSKARKTSHDENATTRRDAASHGRARHGAGAPVAVEHRRFLSSDCAHWHTAPSPTRASKTMF